MDSKPFWQSKVLWANVLALVVTILEGAYGATGIPPVYLTYIILAMNFVLRFLTHKELSGN